MSASALDRLMFAQGNRCFFCQKTLARSEASIEHLLATSMGGGNAAANCVACCKSLNQLFGSMSLKEKFQVVLNQKGTFACPAPLHVDAPLPVVINTLGGAGDGSAQLELVVANLISRKSAKPRTYATLRNTIATLLPTGSATEIDALLASLTVAGKVEFNGKKVLKYNL